MAVIDILFDVAGEFQTTDITALARVNRFIGYAALEIYRDVWDTKADMATALLAAHKLVLGGRGGTQVGPVIADKTGDISRSYGNPINSNEGLDPFDTTAYGVQFKQLRSTVMAGGYVI
jgi:hypothetical protein